MLFQNINWIKNKNKKIIKIKININSKTNSTLISNGNPEKRPRF